MNQFDLGLGTNTFVVSGDRALTLSGVPEPVTGLLLGFGSVSIAFFRRRS